MDSREENMKSLLKELDALFKKEEQDPRNIRDPLHQAKVQALTERFRLFTQDETHTNTHPSSTSLQTARELVLALETHLSNQNLAAPENRKKVIEIANDLRNELSRPAPKF